MKRLVLVMAIVFAFGVTYASNINKEGKKAKTEQVNSVSTDKKETKKAEKKEGCCEKKEGCSEKKEGCCSDKSKSSEEKKPTEEKK